MMTTGAAINALSQTLYDAAKTLGPPAGLGGVRLRQVQITAVDTATSTCTVVLDGDTTSPISGVRPVPPYVPRVGEWTWAWQNDSDLMVTFGPDSFACTARVLRTTAQSLTQLPTINTISFDTVQGANGDPYGIWNGSTNLTAPWSGWYHVGGSVYIAGGSAANVRRACDIRLTNSAGGTIARDEYPSISPPVQEVRNPHTVYYLPAGQVIVVCAFQGGSGAVNADPLGDVASVGYMSYIGP